MIKKIFFSIFIFLCCIVNIIIAKNIKNYIDILNVCFNQEIVITNKLYTTIYIIMAFISIFTVLDILLIFKKPKDKKGVNFKSEDGTYGTATWMNENEIRKILGNDKIPGIILGKYNNEIVKLPFESYFNKNICVFGSSGSMKTTAFLLTNLLELSTYKKSIIVTDPKAEIYRITSDYFRKIGYTVKVFNLKDMRHSDRWNPLAENENINDIQMSANIIISNTQRKTGVGDEFWPRAEENLLKAFEFYFLQILIDKNNLTNIYKKIASGDIGEIDSMFKGLSNENPAKMSYNIFASGSDTIKASVITGLGTRLQLFQNEDLQRLTSESDIDLTLPGKEPCIYYVITDDMNGAYDFLSSLFYTFLFIKLVRYADERPDGKCENEVYCFLDEFANIGQIPDFNRKISTVRSRGLALIPITQNLGQLQNRYPNNLAEEIIGNCDIRIGLGTTDTLTAEFFCELMGIATAETTSVKKSNSIEGDLEEYGQKSIAAVQRNLLNKDEIMRLPSNKLIVSIRGNKPLLLDKIRYTEHSLAKELKDSSISEYNPKWTKNNTIKNKNVFDKNKQENIKKEDGLSFDNF